MKKEKAFCLIGVILGIAIIVIGIVVMASPPGYRSVDSARDAAFGADYYTEQYKATQIAAKNAGATADNIIELGESLATYIGLGFLVLGVLVCFKHTKQLVLSFSAIDPVCKSDETIYTDALFPSEPFKENTASPETQAEENPLSEEKPINKTNDNNII